ncbi:hypothetical protein FPSE5266_11021 [Fusarium pseudograminearum]|nr:hypothetical protein FPSE5266_11021 [Fusarium pseudograminearum]
MKAHPITICRRHTLCRWIRHHVIATPRFSTSARPRVEWERAYDPQAWILGVLPLIAFTNLIWDDASSAVEEIEKSDSPLSGFVETGQWAAIHRFAFLVNFLEKKDPQHESQAYKALAKCDPGFKKIEMAGYVFDDMDGITALVEWNDLDYLHSWIQANAVPRLSLVPTAIAEEAADVFLNTNYLDCWLSLQSQRESLGIIWAVRSRHLYP